MGDAFSVPFIVSCLYQIGKFMYFFKRGLLPNCFRGMFTLASQIHSDNTRNSSLLGIPHCRTNCRKFSIRFQCPKLFNSLLKSGKFKTVKLSVCVAKDLINPFFPS